MPPPATSTTHLPHIASPQPHSCISIQCKSETKGESDKNSNKTRGICLAPICSSPTSNTKKRNKVAFSDLAPQEIDPLPSPICSSTPESNLSHSYCTIGQYVPLASLEISGDSASPQERSNNSLLSNKADLENECLMDIVEEVLAGNIKIDRFLNDLVAAKLLSDEEASSIAPRYRANADVDADESAIDQLIEVFSNFSWETLLRCRKHITRKLCRLSSVEEYESAQKAAANALRLQHDRGVSADDNTIEERTVFETTPFQNARTSIINEQLMSSKTINTISYDVTKLLALLPGLSLDVEASEVQTNDNVLSRQHCGNQKCLRSNTRSDAIQPINGYFRATLSIENSDKELDQKSKCAITSENHRLVIFLFCADCSLEDWCRRHHLSDQTAIALRRNGFSCPFSLRALSEESIELLTGLSWLHKARLWLAIGEISTSE